MTKQKPIPVSTTARPILMSAPMVRALLSGDKTQTRRAIKPQPAAGLKVEPCHWVGSGWSTATPGAGCECRPVRCPYGRPGDLLWVRECFSYLEYGSLSTHGVHFWANGNPDDGDWTSPKPSIHMPRWASRLTLELTGVRAERLGRISEMDAYAEGVDTQGAAYLAAEHGKLGGAHGPAASVCAYANLWDSINGPGSWDANPWVWCLSFVVHRWNVNAMLEVDLIQEVRP